MVVRHAHMGGQAVLRHLQAPRRSGGSGSPSGLRRAGAPRLGRQQPCRGGGGFRRVGFRPVSRRAFGRPGRRFHRRRTLSAARLRRRDGRGGRRRRRRPRVRPGVDGRLKGDRLLARRRLVAPMADLAPRRGRTGCSSRKTTGVSTSATGLPATGDGSSSTRRRLRPPRPFSTTSPTSTLRRSSCARGVRGSTTPWSPPKTCS